ncbi:TIGR03759 family integrating conjugative element protein [Photorhabdus laumondii]|nr:TIGR03759 family integrating conjugative element protein [Photorhabdus luminescens]
MRKDFFSQRKGVVLIGVVMSLSASAAQVAISEQTETGMKATQQQVTQAENHRIQAQMWGLTEAEFQRYQQLMQGQRGIQSPGLDPLSALGIEAETVQARQRYAELWVKQEYVRTEKELAFQRAVDAAWKRLAPNILPVNLGKGDGIAQGNQGRLALFVKEDCAACDARLAAVLSADREVDIYLVDSEGNDDVLRTWAGKHHIPSEKVRSRKITLNHDKGRWRQFGQGKMPVVLQHENDGWRVVAF